MINLPSYYTYQFTNIDTLQISHIYSTTHLNVFTKSNKNSATLMHKSLFLPKVCRSFSTWKMSELKVELEFWYLVCMLGDRLRGEQDQLCETKFCEAIHIVIKQTRKLSNSTRVKIITNRKIIQ